MLPLEVQIEIRLLGRDPPNVAPRLAIVGTEDDQDLAFAHELMLDDAVHAITADELLQDVPRSSRDNTNDSPLVD